MWPFVWTEYLNCMNQDKNCASHQHRMRIWECIKYSQTFRNRGHGHWTCDRVSTLLSSPMYSNFSPISGMEKAATTANNIIPDYSLFSEKRSIATLRSRSMQLAAQGATRDSVDSRTLLRRRWKEFSWELKNRSHESKLLLAQMNGCELLFDSCSPVPRVTLIHYS